MATVADHVTWYSSTKRGMGSMVAGTNSASEMDKEVLRSDRLRKQFVTNIAIIFSSSHALIAIAKRILPTEWLQYSTAPSPLQLGSANFTATLIELANTPLCDHCITIPSLLWSTVHCHL